MPYATDTATPSADEKNLAGVEGSTHFRSWLFSEQKLRETRAELNKKALDRVLKQKESDVKKGDGKPTMKALTLEEERKLHAFYHNQMCAFFDKFKSPPLPYDTKATAHVFYKRFYLTSSIMDHNPLRIIPTIIFLAGKAEENPVAADGIAKNWGIKLKRLVNQEVAVLEGLRFHLKIYHPRRAVESFISRLKATYPAAEEFDNVMQIALKLLSNSVHTDIQLLFPPSQIALASILIASREIGDNDNINDFTILKTCVGGASMQALRQKLGDVEKVLQRGREIAQAWGSEKKQAWNKEAQYLDRKLKIVLNPLYDPQSKVFKERVKAQKRKKEIERATKNKRIKLEEKARDRKLFGNDGADDDDQPFAIRTNPNFKPKARKPPAPEPPQE
eukprot:CAMPEP_0114502970 /NCGR_PEP_ID=MMETSP0109-20121206/9392_1 /TAXON_ID=29199 /ORGANISM="Chlorarachnion reptans, Strain CCCM449" /LENGTH=389 /DNA_ID=CAMNT_0001680955 /DNA_START=26 /DNA_END=1195 /DNA_ORIENTATION=-